jgi:alpha-ribazole phosphatase
MKTVLIRHTRPCGHEGLCYGRHEVLLAHSFEAEAAEVRRHLPWIPAEIWTSPAKRCRRLADYLAERFILSVRVDERLAEMSFGEWEGKAWESLTGEAVSAWMRNPWTARPPGGETAEELVARVAEVRSEFLARSQERVVIVTHAGVIRAWRSTAEQRPLADLFEEPVTYGGVYPAV